MIAIGSASAAPTMRPKATPRGSEFTFFANQPINTPAISPLKVDPITIPAICDDTSGEETSAESPSNIPRMPPSTRPNTGLFMKVSTRGSHLCTAISSSSLTACEDEERDAHHEVGKDEKDR